MQKCKNLLDTNHFEKQYIANLVLNVYAPVGRGKLTRVVLPAKKEIRGKGRVGGGAVGFF